MAPGRPGLSFFNFSLGLNVSNLTSVSLDGPHFIKFILGLFLTSCGFGVSFYNVFLTFCDFGVPFYKCFCSFVVFGVPFYTCF